MRNIYGSSRVGVEEVNQELLMEPLLDYLQLKPVLLTPLSDQCATTGMWYYDVISTTSTIANINADNYDDVKFTNTNEASNPYSTQVVMNVVPGQTYTLTYDYLAKTNVNSMTCVVYDCVLGTTLQTASSGGTLGTKTVTFTVPTNGSTRARIKWAITKTVTASSTDFTISKITVNGLGLEFESTRTPSYAQNKVGDKRYELANHLGNVLNVINDRKIADNNGSGGLVVFYKPNVISYTDYYAFGQALPNRRKDETEYRYGFNGMEKDNEIKNTSGTSYTSEWRQLDPRIGRWFSVDPIVHYDLSPYNTFDNNPILIKDPSGANGEGGGDDKPKKDKPAPMPSLPSQTFITPSNNSSNNRVDGEDATEALKAIITSHTDNTYGDLQYTDNQVAGHTAANNAIEIMQEMLFWSSKTRFAGELIEGGDDDDIIFSYKITNISVKEEISAPTYQSTSTVGGNKNSNTSGQTSTSASGGMSGANPTVGVTVGTTSTAGGGNISSGGGTVSNGAYRVTYDIVVSVWINEGTGVFWEQKSYTKTIKGGTGILYSPTPIFLTK